MKQGIYKIRNIVNEKFYVGSATSFIARWNLHKKQANSGCHHSIHFQRAWEKYGENSFIFEIIEEVNDKKLLLAREQFWLDALKPWDPSVGYNMCVTAGSQAGRKWTLEQKEAHSKRVRGEGNGMFGKKGEANPNFGSKRTEVQKAKMSMVQSGEKNPLYGKFGKNSPNAKKILQKTLSGAIVKEWDCLTDIYVMLGFNPGNISSCCRGRLKHSRGFKWEYK